MPFILGAVAVAVAAVAGWLARPLRLDPTRRAALVSAVGAVDRELAANLELLAMFDQTKQAVVLENGEYTRNRLVIERDGGAAAAALAELYARMPDAEAAMERRGPANTIKDEDRRVIDAWEGDARVVQRALRASLDARPRWGWRAVSARLGGGRVSR